MSIVCLVAADGIVACYHPSTRKRPLGEVSTSRGTPRETESWKLFEADSSKRIKSSGVFVCVEEQMCRWED
jgi:hypothetical protein